MKKLLCALILVAACTASIYISKERESCEQTRDSPVELADPYVFYYDNKYYAYGTRHADGILVYTSDDLTTWEIAENGRDGLALHKDDSYGDKHFWAPEVYYLNGEFVMYYTAQQRICVAFADSPLGPFKQRKQEPMFGPNGGDFEYGDLSDSFCIDNHLFIDDDGKGYVYFVRAVDGLNTWVAELEDDYATIKEGTLKYCIGADLSEGSWENIWPSVNEGPFVNKHKDTYYMTYSANSYESRDYAIGYATAPTPLGPWTKSSTNPILRRADGLVGTGHHGNFIDKDGELRIAFHSHKNDSTIHHRIMHISDIKFVENPKGGADLMTICKDIITPNIIK